MSLKLYLRDMLFHKAFVCSTHKMHTCTLDNHGAVRSRVQYTLRTEPSINLYRARQAGVVSPTHSYTGRKEPKVDKRACHCNAIMAFNERYRGAQCSGN